MSTYTPKVGDTVRPDDHPGADPLLVTAVGKTCFLGEGKYGEDAYEINDDDGGGWVKVEPTPADQYTLIAPDGESYGPMSEDDAVRTVRIWNRPGVSANAPWRVARFSFAEWVVPGE